MSTSEIFKEALALAEKDRAALAGLLITSLEAAPEEGVAEAWNREIARRAAELDAGAAETVTWNELKEKLWKKQHG